MREYATPPVENETLITNLADDLVINAIHAPDQVAIRRPVDQAWSDVTNAELLVAVQSLAAGLMAVGIGQGDRVALMARTRYEWTLLDYAFWYIGVVGVPIYESADADQVAWIIQDSGAIGAFGETTEHIARLRAAAAEMPGLIEDQIWCIDEDCIPLLVALGTGIELADVEERRRAVSGSTLATLIYTSGTTGRPKGCSLTHAHFSAEVDAALAALPMLFTADDAATLLLLPLAHVFARIVQVGSIRAGVCLGHSSDFRALPADLRSFQPTFVLAVPRAFEKLFNTASQRAVADGHARLFQRAVNASIAWSRELDGVRPHLTSKLRRATYERLIYTKMRQVFGGRCTYAICGGAPLGERLAHFYRGLGINVLEGYGLSETTAALTVNTPEAQRIGTVGRPLPGTSVRVSDDGELLFKGPQVFDGYWHDPQQTAAAFDPDGWFRSGDLGEVDDEGFVRITGRKKEILVTAGGKQVIPSALEDRIRGHWLIDQCLVVGDSRPFVAAVITLDPAALAQWQKQHSRPGAPATLVHDIELHHEIQMAVDRANRTVSPAESVRKFVIVPDVWSEETGELTASLKLKRSVLMARCADDIETMYSR